MARSCILASIISTLIAILLIVAVYYYLNLQDSSTNKKENQLNINRSLIDVTKDFLLESSLETGKLNVSGVAFGVVNLSHTKWF